MSITITINSPNTTGYTVVLNGTIEVRPTVSASDDKQVVSHCTCANDTHTIRVDLEKLKTDIINNDLPMKGYRPNDEMSGKLPYTRSGKYVRMDGFKDAERETRYMSRAPISTTERVKGRTHTPIYDTRCDGCENCEECTPNNTATRTTEAGHTLEYVSLPLTTNGGVPFTS